ncbi:hypothetical protein [Sphingopyxis fribergensis]|uniref:hypothetical protein n=1 Tax=Sphingopyxis fribergensis TaxID=1515612 RepID=UPI00057FBBD5|nr:hypothetical protein [Sphingopyxis fribergensis]
MTDRPLLPKGISHDADLSGMTPGDRQRHHTQQLRQVAFYKGKSGVDAYKEQHPEAARLRVNLTALAYAQKPAGYGDAIVNMVGQWFDSDTALAATNKADVERLNDRLEAGRFDPSSHFSKPMSPTLRKRIAALFEQRGATLPPTCKSPSAVKRAVRIARGGSILAATPFAGIGSRTSDTLTIGQRTFAIARHGAHDCIRVTAEGKTQRVSLAVVEVILSGLSEGGGQPALTTTCSIAELVQTPEIDPPDPLADTICGRTCPASEAIESSAADLVQMPEPPTLSDRIRALAAERDAPIPLPFTGRDPLEITTDDL